MANSKRGILFVVSAPSGAGKTTIIRNVVAQLSGIHLSVSYTTRRPRPGEQDGKDYRFISHEEFLTLVNKGALIEWAEVHGTLYGTPKANLQELANDRDLLLEIDTQGARQIREEFGDGVFVFILPPSLKALEERLRARDGDSEDAVAVRLQNAQKELDQASWYDYIVINDMIDDAVSELMSIIIAERCKAYRILKGVKG